MDGDVFCSKRLKEEEGGEGFCPSEEMNKLDIKKGASEKVQ